MIRLSVFGVITSLSWVLCQSTIVTVTGVTTGVDPGTGQRPVRRNINELYASADEQWYFSQTNVELSTGQR